MFAHQTSSLEDMELGQCFVVLGSIFILFGVLLYVSQALDLSTTSYNLGRSKLWWALTTTSDTILVEYEPTKPRNVLREAIHAIKRTTLESRASRAGAKTLRTFWKVNNPFTSDSTELQQAYRTTLIKHLSGTDAEDWICMSQTVSKLLNGMIREEFGIDGTIQKSLNLADASRDATLAAMLRRCFDLDDTPLERIRYVSTEIHRLTLIKKHLDVRELEQGSVPVEHKRDMNRLIDNCCDLFSTARDTSPLAQHILCSVSGDRDNFNPLDLLLPAFEAPWRGVFYTLLAVLQLEHDAIKALRDSYPGQTPSPAALAIVYESLRLYPPIRRVRGETTVDIERIQRDTKFWGLDAGVFNPSRFLRTDGTINQSRISPLSAWMPFSVGRFKCPSAGGFSARMIVVVVGEILRTILANDCGTDECSADHRGTNWYLRGEEWGDAARQGHTLRAGREEYSTVDIVVQTTEPKHKRL